MGVEESIHPDGKGATHKFDLANAVAGISSRRVSVSLRPGVGSRVNPADGRMCRRPGCFLQVVGGAKAAVGDTPGPLGADETEINACPAFAASRWPAGRTDGQAPSSGGLIGRLVLVR